MWNVRALNRVQDSSTTLQEVKWKEKGQDEDRKTGILRTISFELILM